MIEKAMTAQDFLQLPQTTQPTQLINGDVIVSPSPSIMHQIISGNAHLLLGNLITSGRWVYAPMDVHFDDENIFQPDLFWIAPDSKRCVQVEGRYFRGAPDLVIEIISPGTARQDRSVKFLVYEKSGVREYWIIDPESRNIEVWRLVDRQFLRQGVYSTSFESAVLSSATINTEAIFSGVE